MDVSQKGQAPARRRFSVTKNPTLEMSRRRQVGQKVFERSS